MNRPDAPGRLPKRDYVLLPLVAALTVLCMGTAAEGVARTIWPDDELDRCTIADGTAAHFKPNCVARVKMAESPWVTYAYNDCGLRSAESCRLPAVRVAVLGSSIARGYFVPYEQSFAARASRYFTERCGKLVSFQNFALPKSRGPDGPAWHTIDERVPQAVKINPVAAVMIVGPFDMEQYVAVPRALGGAPQPKGAGDPKGFKLWLQSVKADSRAIYMAEHFFYENVDRYQALSLLHGDQIDFLRPPFTPAWRMRLAIADKVIGKAADEMKARSIPFVVIFVPNRLQASLSAHNKVGADPYALGNALQGIVNRHGARFVDMTPSVSKLSNPAAYYYPTDGHPMGAGHALIAQAAEQALNEAAAPLAHCGAQARLRDPRADAASLQ